MTKHISQSAKFLRIFFLLLLALPLALFVMIGKRFFKSSEVGTVHASGIIHEASADVPSDCSSCVTGSCDASCSGSCSGGCGTGAGGCSSDNSGSSY